jgi:hypothetical protein
VAYTQRRTLINKTGKDIITMLQKEYPEVQWYLTLKEGREVCCGIKDAKIIVVGSTYESIKDNMSL